MKIPYARSILFLTLQAILIAMPGHGQTEPAVAQEEVLATVNGEPVTMSDLFRQAASFHGEIDASTSPVGGLDAEALLDRLINLRLILQEAYAIGLDELPEVTRRLAEGRLDLLRRFISQAAIEEIQAGDPEIAEQFFREEVREVQLDAVLFSRQDDAEYFRLAMQGGGDFKAQAERMKLLGKVEKIDETEFLRTKEILPALAAKLITMEPGEISPPIPAGKGFTVVRLNDSRYPDDPAARAEAEAKALEIRQLERLQEYTQGMRERYIEIDRELVESLDFDGASAELREQLQDDRRTVAEVQGTDPITVADLTQGLESKFFHGMNRAVGRKGVNDEVFGVLDRLALERAAELESERLGIEESLEFQAAYRNFVESLLFSAFVNRVITPDVKLEESTLQAYYAEHITDYSSPEMIRLQGLAYRERQDAESALEKLRRGADIQWMRENSSGQFSPEEGEPVLVLDGSLITVSSLPDGLRDAVAGASKNDFRFYGEPTGPYYAIHVAEVIPPSPRPYDEVREQIGGLVLSEQQRLAIDRYTAELRQASEIEHLVNDDQLEAMLGMASQEKT